MIIFGVLLFAIIVLIAVKAILALQRGARYRFGFFDGGLLLQGKDVSPKTMLGVAGGLLLFQVVAFAWPLGAFDGLGALGSPCNDLITEDEIEAMVPGEFGSLRVHHLDTSCTASASDRDIRGRIAVELSGSLGRNLAYEMSPARPGDTRIEDDFYHVDRGHEVDLYVVVGDGGGKLTLSTRHFDSEEIQALGTRLRERTPSLVASFVEADAAMFARPGFLRRNLPWVFLAFCGFLLVGGVLFVRLRRARAMRRALEE
ncbi:MAG: hypothetical protein AAGE52_22795 [Myxococcota bacterium]